MNLLSKICISIVVAMLALPIQAQTAHLEGCFSRDYSDAHLASHPQQVVDQITVGFIEMTALPIAIMTVLTADQGLVYDNGLGGQVFEQILICNARPDLSGGWRCSVECDAGGMDVLAVNDEMLEFKTHYLIVGETDECGGAIDPAEVPREPVTYRLNRVADAQCAAMLSAF